MAKTNEVKVQDWYINQTTMPDYRYWESQEWLDARRMMNAWFDTRLPISNNTVYYAISSGLVTASAWAGASVTLIWYADNTSSPSTIIQQASINTATAVTEWLSITYPVLRWEYYKVNSSSWLTVWYFTPTY